jgi:hypothetical protein
MYKQKKDKEKEESKILYLRAESAEDICRLACKFDFTSDTLVLPTSEKSGRLIALGERVDETQIAYYAPVKGSGGIILYEPATSEHNERMSFTTNTDLPGKQYISVLRADLSGFSSAKTIEAKKIQLVRILEPADLVGAIIRKAASDEKIAHVYAFSSGNKKLLGAFEVLGSLSDDKPIFYYAETDGSKLGNFARYDYRANVLDFTGVMEGHAYMYAKVINLAEPFPFLEKTKK